MNRLQLSNRLYPSALGTGLALVLAAPCLAQTTGNPNDFRLQPRPTPTAPVVGPTDEAAPRSPAPAPTPTRAAPTAAPVITLPPPPRAATPTPAPTPSQAIPAARPAGSSPAPEVAEPAPAPTAANGSLFPTAPAPIAPAASATLDRPVPLPQPSDAGNSLWWLWPLLAALAAVAGGIALLAWRRRSAERVKVPEFIPPKVPQAEPAPQADEPEATPASTPVAVPRTHPSPGEPLQIELQATRMSATLVNAVLTYRLTVRNAGAIPLGNIAIAGDMIAAHASVPEAQMLGGAGVALPGLHRLAALAPGESVDLTGEIRLPLAAIIPIRRGDAHLFVPLARLVAVAEAGGVPVRSRRAFLIGQEGAAGARLQPFRLDLGPRLYSRLGQRPIGLAA